MIVAHSLTNHSRLVPTAGIAIGPILFIIAVLGILAAAIAAGSGSFSTGTTNESNRAKATAMIDIGQNLKIGFDRIMGNGIDIPNVVIDPTQTSGATHLFSPSGGGIAAPSVTMAAAPATDTWHYPLWAIPNIGNSANGNRMAILRVAEGVCTEINSKVNAIATPAAVDLDDFSVTTLNPLTNWPGDLDGKMTGCVANTDATAIPAGFYFYQVLGIQ